MNYLNLILLFARYYDQVSIEGNSEVMRGKHDFKQFKRSYNNLIVEYVEKIKNIQVYEEIYKIFSNDFIITYRRVQFIKLFYILSEFYYNNVSATKRHHTTKYFIQLYECFINENNSSGLITEREKQIIEAIAIRIMFEYPISDNFYNVFTNKKKRKIQPQQNENDFIVKPSHFRSSTQPLDSISPTKNQRITFNDNQIQFNDDNNNNNELYDYQEYERLLHKLCLCEVNNDYTLRSIFLVILEHNNKKYLTPKQKVKFISKNCTVNLYETKEQFMDIPFKDLITLSYYNKDIQHQMMNIALLYERNFMNLSLYSYEMYLFFLMNIINNHSDNKCTFNHFVKSKRVNTKILLAAFMYYKNNTNIFVNTFQNIIENILPYSRNSFIFDFIYQIIILGYEDNIDVGQQKVCDCLINWIFTIENKPIKYYMLSKIQIILFLDKLISNKKIWQQYNKPPIQINPLVFVSLFQDDLKLTKFNVLYENNANVLLEKHKSKTYIETIYDLVLKLFKLTNNQSYLHTLETLFQEDKLLYDLDHKFYKTKDNTNLMNMLFDNKKYEYELCSVPSFSMLFLVKHIRHYNEMTKDDMKCVFKWMAIKAFRCVKKVFGEIRTAKGDMVYKAKHKDKTNERLLQKKIVYNESKTMLEEGLKKKTLNDDNIITVLTEVIMKHKDFKLYTYDTNELRNSNTNKIVFQIDNLNEVVAQDDVVDANDNIDNEDYDNGGETNLDDSFSSCKSTKSVQKMCNDNKEKRFLIPQTLNKKTTGLFFGLIKDSLELKDKHDLLSSSFNNDIEITTSSLLSSHNKEHSSTQNEHTSYDLDLNHIKKSKQVCFFPTSTFIKQIFGIYFSNVLFYDNNFVQMQKYYKYYIEKINNNKIEQYVNITNYPKYPSIIKNYTPTWLFYNGLFMRKEFDFFTNEFFAKTHSYYIEQAKQLNINTMFRRRCHDACIDNFVNSNLKEDTYSKFPCELITNKNVIFGEIILSSSFIYFRHKDKEQFLQNKKLEEKEKFLLCSYETDLSKRSKKILIFKEDICEIVNRRFLYQFQACEIFLENGKSYFFNLFTEAKKIEFFATLKLNDKIITDLKGHMRRKEYSKLWLQGTISNLQYLLFINKYASRSYNDTNQYPVMPWLNLKNNVERDFKYSTVAQNESQREYLLTKYDMTFTSFRNHFNIHFSNSSFVIYYLVRLNPFTNGQITLQNGKFDSPNRQFCSIEDCLNILERSYDSRELIPHFFLNQDFFYNYNCNFFGFRERSHKVVHELTVLNKEQELINSICPNREMLPITYITRNAQLLNSQKVRENLHHFINNIFGVRQIGKREDYNTYDKYCYQEMINLSGKIDGYKLKSLTYEEIKEKIDRKINKVLSFGQTPYKIFEIPHQPFETPTANQKGDSSGNNKLELYSNTKQKLLFIKHSHLKDKEDTSIIYSISVLNRNEIILNTFDNNLTELKKQKHIFKVRIKLLKRLYLFNNSSIYTFQYNPKFSLIDLNYRYFIICRFTDNSFIIYDTDNASQSQRVLTESYITTIVKTNDTTFITGHFNGKIIVWNTLNNCIEPKAIRSVMAHKKAVNSIVYNHMLGLLISSGNDQVIYIRKFFDFEILGCIEIGNSFIYEMKIRNNYLYTLAFNDNIKSFCMRVFTLNGICVHTGEGDLINNFDIDENNRVIVGYFQTNTIKVFSPDMAKVEVEIDLNEERKKKGIIEKKGECNFNGFIYIKKVGIIAYFSTSEIMKIPL